MSIINFVTNFDGIDTPIVVKSVVTQAYGLNTGATPSLTGTAASGLFGAGSIITKIDLWGTCTALGVTNGQTFSIYATNTTPFASPYGGGSSSANTLEGQPLYLSLGGTYTIPGYQLCTALPEDCWLQVICNNSGSVTVSDPLNLCVTYLSHASYSN